jgi:membrane protein
MDQLLGRGRALLRRSLDDDIAGSSAELAYRFLFALFPFMIFLSALGGFVASWLGIPDPATRVLDAAGSDLPPELVATIRPELEAVLGSTSPGLLSFGALAALWAATGGTNALIKAMNRAYGVEDTRGFVQRYLLALGLTVLAVGGIVASFVVIAGGAVLTAEVVAPLGIGSVLWTAIEILRYPAVLALLIVAVAALYRLAPVVRAPWRLALGGATVFAVGWVLATAAFSVYLSRFGSYASTYGSFAGVIVLMLWFYLSALVLLVGAEVVAVLSPGEADEASAPESSASEAAMPDLQSLEDASHQPVPVVAGMGAPRPVPTRVRPGWSIVLPAALVGVAMAVGAFLGAATERLLPRDE